MSSLSPRVVVLCLREHKLRGVNVGRNTRMLWRTDDFWALETSPSNEVEDTRLGVGKEGIAMCFRPRLQPLIYHQGSLAINRIQ